MSIPLQAAKEAAVDQNFRALGQRFPLKSQDLADNSVGSSEIAAEAVGPPELAKEAVTDEKLASPVIRGQVSAEGVLALGTGFTCEKTGVGLYTIKFTTEFSTEPIVDAWPIGSATIGTVNLATNGKKEVKLENRDGVGTLRNVPFQFMAVKS